MQTDQRIIVAMTELLRRQGYAATGIKQVAEASDAPIGSVYHHFRDGKRAVAAAALRDSGAAYGELMVGLLAPYDDVVEGIGAAFTAAAADIEQTGWANMCPVGTIAAEVADSEPELRAVAAEVFDSWITRGTALFVERGFADDDARTLIIALVGALEGAFIMARTLRSAEPITAAGRAMTAFAAGLPVDQISARYSSSLSGTTNADNVNRN